MVPPLRYIRQCIAKADTPHLMLMSKERVYSSLPPNDFHMPGMRNEPLLKVFSLERHLFSAYMRKVATSPNSSSNSTDSLWRINQTFRYCFQNFILDIWTSGYIFCGPAMSTSRMLISSMLGSIYNWSPLLTIVFIISERRDNMMIIQGRNVSWNRTTVPRKAK